MLQDVYDTKICKKPLIVLLSLMDIKFDRNSSVAYLRRKLNIFIGHVQRDLLSYEDNQLKYDVRQGTVTNDSVDDVNTVNLWPDIVSDTVKEKCLEDFKTKTSSEYLRQYISGVCGERKNKKDYYTC